MIGGGGGSDSPIPLRPPRSSPAPFPTTLTTLLPYYPNARISLVSAAHLELGDGLLRGEEAEALLARDALLGEFIVGAESRGVRGLGGAAVGRGLLQGVDPDTLLVELVHEVHGVRPRVCSSVASDRLSGGPRIHTKK